VFISFLRRSANRAREKRCAFRLIASKGNVCRDFRIAVAHHPGAWNILLKDSEGPGSGTLSIALCEEKRWSASHADSIFWMVEMMESWFHADKEALQSFYGPRFRKNALKSNPNSRPQAVGSDPAGSGSKIRTSL